MKYSKEILEEAVSKSTSVAQVLRQLGLKQAGGNHSYISGKITKFKIDTAHFTGQAWNKGKVSNKRKKAKDILVFKEDSRIRGHQLVRALLEKGIAHECEDCKTGPLYNGKKLTLQVDHRNGDWRNNSLENLRFLCPNCHSQTETFGSKNKI